MGAERIVLAHNAPLQLGGLDIRPGTREVVHGARTAVLEPRVMQVLVALARAPGTVLARDDLTEQCWEGRVVGEDAINRVLSRLRAVSREVGGFKVETINKVGYRLVEVDEGGEATNAGLKSQQAMSGEQRTPRGTDRRLVLGGAAAGLAAMAGGWWLLEPGRRETAEAPQIAEARALLRAGMPDDTAESVAILQSVVRTDPENAAAWGALALAYERQANYSENPRGFEERAAAAVRRALALDPDQADAIAARAVSVQQYGNWARAERTLRDALARHPKHPWLLATLGLLLNSTGRASAALPMHDQALAVEPNSSYSAAWRVQAYWSLGRLEEAERASDEAIRRWPRHFFVWFVRVYLFGYSGRSNEALAMLANRDTRPPGIPESGFENAAVGIRALATRAPADIDAAVSLHWSLAPKGTGFAENAANFAAALGRPEMALRVLDAVFFGRGFTVAQTRFGADQGRNSTLKRRHTAFLFNPPLASLRGHPRFEALLREIGLEDYWRETRTVPDYRRT